MRTISAIYGCNHCAFESTNIEEMRKHEAACMFNPLNTEAKMVLISAMKDSSTLKELNGLLDKAICKDIIPEPENKMKYSFYGSEQNYNFYINRYHLANPYAEYFESYGISMNIEDYPKINALVQEMKEINKSSSEYNKNFNSHKKQALKKAKEESIEFLNAKADLDEILDEARYIETKRAQLNKIHDDVIKKLENKIEKDYNYVNPNIRLAEIQENLK